MLIDTLLLEDPDELAATGGLGKGRLLPPGGDVGVVNGLPSTVSRTNKVSLYNMNHAETC